MSSINNRTVHKILIIVFICLAVVLTIVGILLINLSPLTGSRQTLDQQMSLVSEIRETSNYLSDDDFIFGLNNVIPQDTTDKELIDDALQKLEDELKTVISESVYVEYLSSFGNPAALVILPDTYNLAEVLTVFQKANLFTKIYIMMASTDTDIVSFEYLYSEGLLHELYQPHSLNLTEMSEKVKSMCDMIMYEYGLTAESFQYSGSELRIDVTSLSYDDALCVFDYSWQYLQHEDIALDLTVFDETILLASASTEDSSTYSKYYPSSDLAPLYRLMYYYQNNFFKNGLRVTCQRYLK